MKTYLFINSVEEDSSEIIIKVEPLYCAERDTDVISINDKEYTPTKGDKLYFLSGVNIPRVKLKDLSLQHGTKTTKDIDDATHIFAGKNTKDKLISSHWYYSIDTSIIRNMIADPETQIDDYYRQNLETALEFYTEDKIIVDYSTCSTLRNSEHPSIKKYIDPRSLRNSSIYYTVDDEYSDLFPKILSLDVYHEDKLLKHINGDDAATIDETMFHQISDMFKSSDEDNHVLAMEIMANCNYNDSLLYLEMLFEKHSNRMSNSRTKNHVNFKSLLSYLGKNKNYMNTDPDDIMKSLINKNFIDLDKINVIMKYYGEQIAARGGNDYFDVKSITLNKDYAKLLDTNYVHELIPDFIPETDSDMSEIHGNLIELNSTEIEDVVLAHEPVELEDNELLDEDIEEAFTIIERNELKSDLITLEEEKEFPEDESIFTEAEDYALGEIMSKLAEEHESNNHQITQKNDTDFEWF